MNYTKIKQLYLSLLPLFVTRTRKEKKEKRKRKNLGRRMSTSFLAHRMKTRRGVVREVRNPVHNGVIRGRGEAANIFKIGEELHKSQRVSPGGRRTEKADKCRKDF